MYHISTLLQSKYNDVGIQNTLYSKYWVQNKKQSLKIEQILLHF